MSFYVKLRAAQEEVAKGIKEAIERRKLSGDILHDIDDIIPYVYFDGKNRIKVKVERFTARNQFFTAPINYDEVVAAMELSARDMAEKRAKFKTVHNVVDEMNKKYDTNIVAYSGPCGYNITLMKLDRNKIDDILRFLKEKEYI